MKLTKRLFLKTKLRFIELQIWNLTYLARGTGVFDARLTELDIIHQSLIRYLNE